MDTIRVSVKQHRFAQHQGAGLFPLDHMNHLRRACLSYAGGILQSRRLILELTHREFRARHLGSGLGLVWAFTHPAVMMAIYLLVFTVLMPAVGANKIESAPFIIWLLAGLVPWFLASDSIGSGPSAVLDNRFLVKKVVFRTSLLPIIRLLSNLPVHLFLLTVIIGIFWARGYPPSIYTFQLIYYLGALLTLCLGWSLLMSALVPFLKDLGQVVQVILQIAFWATPLIWHVEGAGKLYKAVAYLNPLCYIVQGYRESLVYHQWFWRPPLVSLYYWMITIALLIAGGLVFSRLKGHFADVL